MYCIYIVTITGFLKTWLGIRQINFILIMESVRF